MPQIRQFQEYWDALLEGNLAARRHTRFVPGGLKYQPIRDVPLKDDFDEWLARVVCFAFSVPPTAFSKQTNRATAESAQDAATAEGLQPLLVWLKGLVDRIIGEVLGCPDLEFAWADRTAPDPQTQATIAAAYVGAGIKTRNEVRAELGLDPIAGGDTLTTATPAAALPGGMAKLNSNWAAQPRDQGRWATSGGSSTGLLQPAQEFILADPPLEFVPPEAVEPLPGIGGRPLPANPDDLVQQGYKETSDPEAAAAGHRTFENPKTGDTLRFDEGEPGQPGYRGQDHYHRENPDSAGKQDRYLDKNGNPVPKGSNPSHLTAGDWI